MSLYFYLLAVIFVAAILYFKFRDPEPTVYAVVLGAVIALAGYYVPLAVSSNDTELISGAVTKKERVYDEEIETYICGHDSHGNAKYCTRTIPRWRWDIISNIGDSYSDYTYSKNRMPEIYAATQVGDPYSDTRTFKNYQRVSSQTVKFNRELEYKGWLPPYPAIYGGFKVSRAFSLVDGVDQRELSKALSIAHRSWGPSYGANAIVVILNDATDIASFREALYTKWNGGKKNDAVLILKLDKENKVSDVRTFGRSSDNATDEKGRSFTQRLIEESKALGEYSPEKVVNVINGSLPLFYREDLRKYDFLETEYAPPLWLDILIFALIVIAMTLTVNSMSDRYRLFSRRRAYW
ncbi:hypothetical protein D3C80_689060 [compost metagenome]